MQQAYEAQEKESGKGPLTGETTLPPPPGMLGAWAVS